MIREYILVTARDETDLTKRVNEHIKKGYQPFGSPVVTAIAEHPDDSQTEMECVFCQAVVIED